MESTHQSMRGRRRSNETVYRNVLMHDAGVIHGPAPGIRSIDLDWDNSGDLAFEAAPVSTGEPVVDADAAEQVFENTDYGYRLTVASADTELSLRSGRAIRYTLEATGTAEVDELGVYGDAIVFTVPGSTLFVSLETGEVQHTIAGNDPQIYPVLSGTFRAETDPEALYRVQNDTWTYGDYVVCDDPDTVSPLILLETDDETYDVFNTETGEYFGYASRASCLIPAMTSTAWTACSSAIKTTLL